MSGEMENPGCILIITVRGEERGISEEHQEVRFFQEIDRNMDDENKLGVGG